MTEQLTLSERNSHADTGKAVIVDVFARAERDGRVTFSHEWRWGSGPSEGTGTIKIPKRLPSEPGTMLHFHLRDETSPKRHLEFAEKEGAAMWVLRNACPPEWKRSDDPQIPPDRMVTGPKLLKVFDENSEECDLHYRLWFQDKDGNWDAYDPDIKNGGKV
jgi:hypothetical protein